MTVDIVFDGPPGPECGRFVEVEDESGASIRLGEWVQRSDGYWVLRIPDPRPADEVVSADSSERRDEGGTPCVVLGFTQDELDQMRAWAHPDAIETWIHRLIERHLNEMADHRWDHSRGRGGRRQPGQRDQAGPDVAPRTLGERGECE